MNVESYFLPNVNFYPEGHRNPLTCHGSGLAQTHRCSFYGDWFPVPFWRLSAAQCRAYFGGFQLRAGEMKKWEGGKKVRMDRRYGIIVKDQIARSTARRPLRIRPLPNSPRRPSKWFLQSDAHPSDEKEIVPSCQGAGMEGLAVFGDSPSNVTIPRNCPHRKGEDSILPQGAEIP